VLDTFISKCAAAGIPDAAKCITILAFVDDVVLAFDQNLFAVVWPIYVSTLGEFNLLVETTKCKAWIPDDSPPLPSIAEALTIVTGGLPILGTAAAGNLATFVTVRTDSTHSAALTADASARLESATADAELLTRLVDTPLSVSTKYAAWLLLCRSLAVRLDFDMRILAPTHLSEIVTRFQHTLFKVARKIIGLPNITPQQLIQAQLPGHFGGMFLSSPTAKLQVAHLSSLAASWRPTFEWLTKKGFTSSQAFGAIDCTSARLTLIQLARQCIFVTGIGEICSQYSPVPLLPFDEPLAACVFGLQGRLTNALQHSTALNLWAEMEPGDRTRLLSSAGRGSGAHFRETSKRHCLHLDDHDFQTSAALRLGIALPAPESCQNNSAAGRTCCLPLTTSDFLSCKIGGGVALLHKSLAAQVVQITKDMGATPKTRI